MRRPQMSTGAWIFAGLVTAAIVAPTAVFAAASSTVAIGNLTNASTATVTAGHQLLTTTVAPQSVVRASGYAGNNSCGAVYTPPAGKAIVVTSVSYDMYGNAGGDMYSYLTEAACGIASYDTAETTLGAESEARTFPIGLPMPSVGVNSSGGTTLVWITGYLIPAAALPPAAPALNMPTRAKLHPTQ